MYHEASIIRTHLDGRDLCFESSRIGEQSPQQCKGTWQDSFLDHVTTPKISGSVGLQQNIQSSSLSKGWSNFQNLYLWYLRSIHQLSGILLCLVSCCLKLEVGWYHLNGFFLGSMIRHNSGIQFDVIGIFLCQCLSIFFWCPQRPWPEIFHVLIMYSQVWKPKMTEVSKNIAKTNMLNQCCKLTSFTYILGTLPLSEISHADEMAGPPCPSPASSPRRNYGRYNFCVTRSHLGTF